MINSDYWDYLVSTLNERKTDAFLIRYEDLITDDWYFSDVDMSTVPHAIHWTKSLSQAYKFDNEIDALEFANDFIVPRKVQILRLNK